MAENVIRCWIQIQITFVFRGIDNIKRKRIALGHFEEVCPVQYSQPDKPSNLFLPFNNNGDCYKIG